MACCHGTRPGLSVTVERGPAQASSAMLLLAAPEEALDPAGNTRCCTHHANRSNPNSPLECRISSARDALFLFNRVCRRDGPLPYLGINYGRRKLTQVLLQSR